ncbi:MAG TPA: DUF309 domain-containing protein [Minicystis sp.]|nr:DUF309 domain-containing protein [Minicystis sp.]
MLPVSDVETDPARARRMHHGLAEFERGRFFEAHERWEDAWRSASEPVRTWIQGLIQLAAAFHKLRAGALAPAARLASRAAEKLDGSARALDGIDLLAAHALARDVAAAAAEGRSAAARSIRAAPDQRQS